MSDSWYGWPLESDGRIVRPGDERGPKLHMEAFPTQDGLSLWVGTRGPRDGRRTLLTGNLDYLRMLRLRISEVIEFGEQVEYDRQKWLAEKVPA